MTFPIKLPILIRGLAKTTTSIIGVNLALVAAWLIPIITPLIAIAFIATYLYSFLLGGTQWLQVTGKENA